jgi:hypothetical protein
VWCGGLQPIIYLSIYLSVCLSACLFVCLLLLQLFRCPASRQHLLSHPDLVDHARARAFRDQEPGTWILYQHLRKAGEVPLTH